MRLDSDSHSATFLPFIMCMKRIEAVSDSMFRLYMLSPISPLHDIIVGCWGLDLVPVAVAPWSPDQSRTLDLLTHNIDHPVEMAVT